MVQFTSSLSKTVFKASSVRSSATLLSLVKLMQMNIIICSVLAQELLTEPVALVPVHNSQSGDKEVAANLGQEADVVVGCHLQLLLQYALLGGGGASVGQLHNGGDHFSAVGEAVVDLLHFSIQSTPKTLNSPQKPLSATRTCFF